MSNGYFPAALEGGQAAGQSGSSPTAMSRRALVIGAGVGAAVLGGSAPEAAPAASRAGLGKHIYLAKRKPGFTRDQFVARWRQHGALAMSKPFFQHNILYMQAEPIPSLAMPGVTEDYDAIGYIMGHPHTRTASEDAQLEAMAKDELETFSGLIVPVILTVHETILKAGAMGGVTAFLFSKDPARAATLAERYRASGAERVILNVSRTDIPAGEMSSLIPYRAVVEVSAADLDRLKAVLGSSDAAPWRGADLAVITRECVMWDRLS